MTDMTPSPEGLLPVVATISRLNAFRVTEFT